MTYRIFVGKLSDRTTDSSLRQAFEEYGDVKSVEIKGTYAFVYFDQAQQAQLAIERMNGKELDGSSLVVENARSSSSHQNNGADKSSGKGTRLVRRLDLRILIRDVQRNVSWQDLKDWARNAGDVTYANVFVDHNNDYLGLIEYKDDATLEKALRTMEDIPLKGQRVRVEKDDPDADHHNIPPNRGTLDYRGGRPGNGGGGGYNRGNNDRDRDRDRERDRDFGSRRDGGYGNDGYDRRNGGGSGGGYPVSRDRNSRDRERDRSRSRGGNYGQPAYGQGAPYGDRAGYDDRARGHYVDYREEPRAPQYRDRSRSRSRSPHGGRYSTWEGGDGRAPADYGRSSWQGGSGYQDDRRGRSPVGRYYDDRGYDRR